MPDVTPKTESGRALLTLLDIEDSRGIVARQVLAIEQEAASAAVAEAVEIVRKEVKRGTGRHPEGDNVPQFAGAVVRRLAALIASERKP